MEAKVSAKEATIASLKQDINEIEAAMATLQVLEEVTALKDEVSNSEAVVAAL